MAIGIQPALYQLLNKQQRFSVSAIRLMYKQYGTGSIELAGFCGILTSTTHCSKSRRGRRQVRIGGSSVSTCIRKNCWGFLQPLDQDPSKAIVYPREI